MRRVSFEPAVSEHVTTAILSDSDRHVDPVSFMNGLRAAIEPRGVTVLEGRPVRSLMPGGLGLAGGCRRAAAGRREGGAGDRDGYRGADAATRDPAADDRRQGYSADVAGPEIGRALYLCEAKIGLSPMAHTTRVGGFFEIGATSARPNRRRALQLLTDTSRYIREFPTDLPPDDEGLAGLRPATPDSLPYLGEHPRAPGVIVAAGHGMLGITLAPATATAVAELASGTRPAWLHPFRPDR